MWGGGGFGIAAAAKWRTSLTFFTCCFSLRGA